MEPVWTKKIPSGLICDWFYMLFIINVVVLAFLIISVVVLVFSTRSVSKLQLLTNVILAIFAGTNSLFYYLLCDRALRPV